MSKLSRVADETRALYCEKFGDAAAYHLMTPDPAYYNTIRLIPPNGQAFSEEAWYEFCTYMQNCGRKIKAAFRGGQILIEEYELHGVREAGRGVIIGIVYKYSRDAVGPLSSNILHFRGQSDYRVAGDHLAPDASWVPDRGVNASIFFEIGDTQSVENLMDKVNLIFRNSRSIRYMVLMKVWRDPLPERVAIVVAVWLKTHDAAEGGDWRAIKFTSFGNRPPTSAELAAFPVTRGDRPWVPELDGVIYGSGSVPCDEDNGLLSLFTITLQAKHMFDVPDKDTPAHLTALSDLAILLCLVKNTVVSGIIYDICDNTWVLTNAQYGLIVNSAAVQQHHPRLHKFALQRLESQPIDRT